MAHPIKNQSTAPKLDTKVEANIKSEELGMRALRLVGSPHSAPRKTARIEPGRLARRNPARWSQSENDFTVRLAKRSA